MEETIHNLNLENDKDNIIKKLEITFEEYDKKFKEIFDYIRELDTDIISYKIINKFDNSYFLTCCINDLYDDLDTIGCYLVLTNKINYLTTLIKVGYLNISENMIICSIQFNRKSLKKILNLASNQIIKDCIHILLENEDFNEDMVMKYFKDIDEKILREIIEEYNEEFVVENGPYNF